MYIFFFFDLGLIGAAMLVLIVLGITTVGIWESGLQKIMLLLWR